MPVDLGGDDGVIELDSHIRLLLVPSKMIARAGCASCAAGDRMTFGVKGASDFSETIPVPGD